MSKPRGYRWLVVLFVLANVLIVRGAETPVKVWEAVMTLPVYQEGPPEENPPFDAFEFTRFNYPYTLRENLTGSKKEQALRALYLENEYLKCVVLPDIGGHLYSCTDKINGAELFYANSAIKKAEIGYRGAWAAFGIEFNFPVSHNWVSMSPVDFAIQSQPDGSASIWVGNVDRVYGMQWRVRLVLRPRSSMLEQRVMLYNCSDLRHRFYWWNNAAVQVWDDSRIFYPMRFTASHGFRDIDTWPVNSAGRDLSVISNQLDGPVSRFAHGSREPFMGVYHPKTQAGTVHFAEPAEVPAKKIWSWGADADAMDWRRALSDDNSAYAEIQGGLFRNQETYGFLPSQETLSFREYWIPVREIGGISRANPDGVVYVQRSSASQGKTDLALGMNVTHAIRGRVRVRERSRTLWEQSADFSPERTFKAKIPGVSANEHHTVELIDADGKQLLAYTEDEYDYEPVSAIQLGRQHPAEFPVLAKRSEGDFVEVGNDQELNGKLLVAVETYRQGLERFPKSFSLNKALGRLALALTDFAESERRLRMAQHIVSNDPEIHYLLGLALFARSDFRHAEIEFEHALLFRNYRPAAAFALARLFAQQHDLKRVLEQLQHGIQESPASVRMGAMEVALLRRLGQTELARKRLSYWLALDPTSSALRYEETKLMEDKAGFWQHLAADPERVLDVASDYVDFRFLDDARALLERNYPAVEATYSEPGNVLPQDHPLVHYYRGYCLELQGKSGDEAFAHAASLSSRYVFPHRAGALPVLAKAIEKNPNDAQAHFLLGSLMMSGGNSEGALNEWEQTRRLKPKIPVLHRNMAYTELFLRKSPERALTLFREGLEADPKNLNLYTGITRAMSLLDRPASERVDVLRQYDSSGLLPSVLVYELALSLVEDDKAAEAEGLFKDRFFPRREGGVNVRQVYLEVLLQKALSLAQHGNSAAALNVVNHIESEVPGFSFTKDGLDIFINHARFQFLLGEVYARSGQGEAGKAHWNKAVQLGASGDAVNVAFAVRAARQLDTFDVAVWKARLERSLEHFSSESDEDAGPNATLLYAKGLLLQALGREVEAQAVWKKVPFLPDRGLAHYLVRMARKNP